MKERDLMGGTVELDAILRMISERCERLIVVISQAFLNSHANEFLTSFAQSLGIEQGRRKIIPLLYESLEGKPIPISLRYYHILNYQRSGRYMNFWEKLRDSIKREPQKYLINDNTNPLPK